MKKKQENYEKMSVFEKKVVTLHPLKKCICATWSDLTLI